MRSRSWRFRNLLTTSAPKVKETPRSFSPQPWTSLSGSDHSRSHSRPAEVETREVSVVGKDAGWNLWQASVEEWQHRPLGFWSKVMTFAAKKYTPFEKLLLA